MATPEMEVVGEQERCEQVEKKGTGPRDSHAGRLRADLQGM